MTGKRTHRDHKNEILHKLKKDQKKKSVTIQDPTAHPLFCEISELYSAPSKNLVWRETARLLKFIEVVEASGRWSAPHVATLSLRNLIELRSSLSKGIINLNLQGKDLDSIYEKVTDQCVKEGLINEDQAEQMKDTLQLPHSHQYQKVYLQETDFGDRKHCRQCCKGKKKNGEEGSDESGSEADKGNDQNDEVIDGHASEDENTLSEFNYGKGKDNESLSIDMDSSILKMDAKSKFSSNKAFLKKMSPKSEAAHVLIGEVDYLDEEITIFVRLTRSVAIDNFTEVCIPTKFIFIHLGPVGNMIKYREIGKCMGGLLSDELFQSDIYEAKENQDLLLALDDFLDQSTLLPPGGWDTTIRLGPPGKVPSKEERLILRVIKVKKDRPHQGGHDDDPCLKRTGRFCGGIIQDIKTKAKWYVSDFTDAINFQCVPAIGFLYFACLAPIITFGGLLGYATDNNMGAIESLLSGLVTGVTYSLFSGQPMTIMGSTGPILVFESILNTFSKQHDIDYLGFRCLVGLWICFFLIVIVVTDLSYLVKYITRFTEELFAILIALIFVHESIDKLLKINSKYHFTSNPFNYGKEFSDSSPDCFRCINSKNASVDDDLNVGNFSYLRKKPCEQAGKIFVTNCKYVPDVFFFSVILYLLTFMMAMALRQIKFSSFFPAKIRTQLSNFGVVTTIAVMLTLDHFIGLETPKLMVPENFHPTIPDRGWLVNPIARNPKKFYWLAFAAMLPALLGTVLVFLDQHITAVLVNRKGNKLKKSAGYHLDLLICGICIGVNSVFGIPWFVAATVLSMNHIIALRKISATSVPGETPKLVGVVEQRVTGVVIFGLIGLSIFATKALAYIPMPVLYAIFMYMGVTPMGELEFFQRILLFLMPKKYQPDLVFLRHVRLGRVHLFTLIQIACLILLFVLKLFKAISIVFPMMVLALIFIRFAMSYIFTDKELSYLDDLIPGIENLPKKRMSLNQVNVETLEKVRKEKQHMDFSLEMKKTHVWTDLESERIPKKEKTIRIKSDDDDEKAAGHSLLHNKDK